MMLFKNPQPDPKMDKICVDGDLHTSVYMYRYQREVQMVLVVIAVLMIPIMLFGNPITIIMKRRQRRRQNYTSIEEVTDATANGDPDAKEEGFGDILIIQGKMCPSK